MLCKIYKSRCVVNVKLTFRLLGQVLSLIKTVRRRTVFVNKILIKLFSLWSDLIMSKFIEY